MSYHSYLFCASTTATLTMLMISRTDAPNCMTCTDFFNPTKTGPIASASVISCNNLYAMLPADKFGKIKVFTCLLANCKMKIYPSLNHYSMRNLLELPHQQPMLDIFHVKSQQLLTFSQDLFQEKNQNLNNSTMQFEASL
jgi:hypothetical protein